MKRKSETEESNKSRYLAENVTSDATSYVTSFVQAGRKVKHLIAPPSDEIKKACESAARDLADTWEGLTEEQRKAPLVRDAIAGQLSKRFPELQGVGFSQLAMLVPHIFEFVLEDEAEREKMEPVKESTQMRPTDADRVRRSRENRERAGGESIGMTLKADAASAMNALVSSGAYANKVAAVEAALLNEHKRLQRRMKKQGPARN